MRLLTYNMHKGIGGRDQRYRLDRIVDVIEAINPDLVCLQEVTRDAQKTRYDNQPDLLGEYFHFSNLYQVNVHYIRGGYGNLILSRWPLENSHQISLQYKKKKARGAQLAIIETIEGPLHLVHWHLGLGVRERFWQAGYLLSHRLFRESASLPTLLVGDTNDWRNRLHLGPVGFAGFDHVTRPPSRFRTFPAWLPMGSLDKVFVRGPIEIRHAYVAHSRTIRRASDHLPVVVDFHLRGNRTTSAQTSQ